MSALLSCAGDADGVVPSHVCATPLTRRDTGGLLVHMASRSKTVVQVHVTNGVRLGSTVFSWRGALLKVRRCKLSERQPPTHTPSMSAVPCAIASVRHFTTLAAAPADGSVELRECVSRRGRLCALPAADGQGRRASSAVDSDKRRSRVLVSAARMQQQELRRARTRLMGLPSMHRPTVRHAVHIAMRLLTC